jgi:hypothetical protein
VIDGAADKDLVHGPPLKASALDALRRTVRGALLTPADDGYDAARQVRYAMIDRYRALVARSVGVSRTCDSHHSAQGP